MPQPSKHSVRSPEAFVGGPMLQYPSTMHTMTLQQPPRTSLGSPVDRPAEVPAAFAAEPWLSVSRASTGGSRLMDQSSGILRPSPLPPPMSRPGTEGLTSNLTAARPPQRERGSATPFRNEHNSESRSHAPGASQTPMMAPSRRAVPPRPGMRAMPDAPPAGNSVGFSDANGARPLNAMRADNGRPPDSAPNDGRATTDAKPRVMDSKPRVMDSKPRLPSGSRILDSSNFPSKSRPHETVTRVRVWESTSNADRPRVEHCMPNIAQIEASSPTLSPSLSNSHPIPQVAELIGTSSVSTSSSLNPTAFQQSLASPTKSSQDQRRSQQPARATSGEHQAEVEAVSAIQTPKKTEPSRPVGRSLTGERENRRYRPIEALSFTTKLREVPASQFAFFSAERPGKRAQTAAPRAAEALPDANGIDDRRFYVSYEGQNGVEAGVEGDGNRRDRSDAVRRERKTRNERRDESIIDSAELEELMQRLRAAEALAKNSQKSKQAVELELNRLRVELVTRTNGLQDVQYQIQQSSATFEEMRMEHDRKEDFISSLKEQFQAQQQAYEGTISSFRNRLTATSDLLTEARADLGSARTQLLEVATSLDPAAAYDDNRDLRAEVSTTKAKLQTAERRISELEARTVETGTPAAAGAFQPLTQEERKSAADSALKTKYDSLRRGAASLQVHLKLAKEKEAALFFLLKCANRCLMAERKLRLSSEKKPAEQTEAVDEDYLVLPDDTYILPPTGSSGARDLTHHSESDQVHLLNELLSLRDATIFNLSCQLDHKSQKLKKLEVDFRRRRGRERVSSDGSSRRGNQLPFEPKERSTLEEDYGEAVTLSPRSLYQPRRHDIIIGADMTKPEDAAETATYEMEGVDGGGVLATGADGRPAAFHMPLRTAASSPAALHAGDLVPISKSRGAGKACRLPQTPASMQFERGVNLPPSSSSSSSSLPLHSFEQARCVEATRQSRPSDRPRPRQIQ